MRELGITIRTLRKSPVFTLVAILTLAIGIGANTAIFSVLNAVLLHPLPITDRDRVVFLFQHDKQEKHERGPIAPANFEDFKTRTRSFQEIAAFVSFPGTGVNFGVDGKADRATSASVAPELFPLIGAKPLAGRLFTAQEGEPLTEGQSSRVLLISYGLWQRRFGGQAVVGKEVQINGATSNIIGVMPWDFHFPDNVDVWLPLALSKDTRAARSFWFLNAMARLKPGVSLAQAQADLDVFTNALAKDYPKTNATMAFRLEPVEEVLAGDVRPALLLILGAVGVMMLVACVNLASLLLVRASTRSREFAIRAALGADRGTLIRGTLLESMILALAGGIAGLLLSQAATEILATLAEGQIPRLENLSIDGRVAAFAIGLSVLTGFLFGVLPALQSSRANVADALKSAGERIGSPASSARVRSRLVAAEIALTLVLLTSAGLLLRSFWQTVQTPIGFNTGNLLTLQMDLEGKQYATDAASLGYYDRLKSEIARIPGIVDVAVTNRLPLSREAGPTSWLTVAGRPAPSGGAPPEVNYRVTDTGYFRTMGIQLRSGRLFDSTDTPKNPRVAVVNETIARRFFPNENALLKQIYLGPVTPRSKPYTIVGIASDVRQSSLQEPPKPEAYTPHTQDAEQYMTLVIRASADPRPLIGSIRAAVASIDSSQPPYQIRTMRQLIGASVAPQRLYSSLLTVFAGFALLLAAIGVYGVLTYSVAQRVRDIAIRMALGAQRREVLREVLADGGKVVAAGLGVGIVASLAATRLLGNLLYGVKPWDPATFIAVSLLMGGAALLAAWLPAQRATRVDPIEALRHE